MTVRIGVLLSGSGHRDGAEISEAVLALFGLEIAGAETVCLSRDKDQACVVDHLTGDTTSTCRNVMKEAARIARGKVRDVTTVDVSELDGVVVVGGMGAALNFCDFATRGEHMVVDPEVARFLTSMHVARKPIGGICIAPIILARLFGAEQVRLTFGDAGEVSEIAAKWGAVHVKASALETVVDEACLIVTTPAYMVAKRTSDLRGILRLAEDVVRLAGVKR